MLNLNNINIKIGNFELIDININVNKGDYYTILGASGAGKSVLLETIAGIVRQQSGQIILNGKDVTNKAIQNRNIGLVFQDFAVFPNMSVKENLAYSLKCKHKPKAFIDKKVTEIADTVSVTHLLNRNPKGLSGGELQRVALGRTLIQQPDVLLLDEPLSSLDIELKNNLQVLLRSINLKGQTIIHITHDYKEALALANKISVLNNGKIEQTGSPDEIFNKPKSKFVASFTGMQNFFSATTNGKNKAQLENIYEISIPEGTYPKHGYITFRTNDVILSNEKLDSSISNESKAIVTDIKPVSQGVEITTMGALPIIAFITRKSVDNLKLKVGCEIWVGFKATAVTFLPHL